MVFLYFFFLLLLVLLLLLFFLLPPFFLLRHENKKGTVLTLYDLYIFASKYDRDIFNRYDDLLI